MKATKENLVNYLEWLITPQNEREQELFKEVVDDYIGLKSRIQSMSENELVREINIQLKPYGLTCPLDYDTNQAR